jgi:hypothetical protein
VRDIRKQQKAERNYYAGNSPQQCRQCGRLFVRGRGDVCSMGCKEKAEAADKKSSWRGD